jgi:hypothetical protein
MELGVQMPGGPPEGMMMPEEQMMPPEQQMELPL